MNGEMAEHGVVQTGPVAHPLAVGSAVLRFCQACAHTGGLAPARPPGRQASCRESEYPHELVYSLLGFASSPQPT